MLNTIVKHEVEHNLAQIRALQLGGDGAIIHEAAACESQLDNILYLDELGHKPNYELIGRILDKARAFRKEQAARLCH